MGLNGAPATVGIADGGADGPDTRIWTERAASAAAERGMDVLYDHRMAGRTAGHGDRLEAVELVAAFLRGSPGEELLLGPGTAERDVLQGKLIMGGFLRQSARDQMLRRARRPRGEAIR